MTTKLNAPRVADYPFIPADEIGRVYTVEGPEILTRLEAIEKRLALVDKWNDVYAHYVIKDVNPHSNTYGYYVGGGGNNPEWVSLIRFALSFTRKGVEVYLQNHAGGMWMAEEKSYQN